VVGGIDGEVLSELDESIREEVIAKPCRDDVVAEAVRELDSDDVVDIVEDLEPSRSRARSLARWMTADRVAVEQALAYPEYSAGRLMQREVVVRPSTGRWARRSISCAKRRVCPTSSIM
jgi:magnesium transporter